MSGTAMIASASLSRKEIANALLSGAGLPSTKTTTRTDSPLNRGCVDSCADIAGTAVSEIQSSAVVCRAQDGRGAATIETATKIRLAQRKQNVTSLLQLHIATRCYNQRAALSGVHEMCQLILHVRGQGDSPLYGFALEAHRALQGEHYVFRNGRGVHFVKLIRNRCGPEAQASTIDVHTQGLLEADGV